MTVRCAISFGSIIKWSVDSFLPSWSIMYSMFLSVLDWFWPLQNAIIMQAIREINNNLFFIRLILFLTSYLDNICELTSRCVIILSKLRIKILVSAIIIISCHE